MAIQRHRCLAEGCKQRIEARFLMCGVHWRLVPKPIQDRVYAAYIPGQTAVTASAEWETAAQEAILAVRSASEKGAAR